MSRVWSIFSRLLKLFPSTMAYANRQRPGQLYRMSWPDHDQYTSFPREFTVKILHRDLAEDALTGPFGEGYFRQLKT